MNRNKKDVSVIIAEIVNAAEDGTQQRRYPSCLKKKAA